MIKEIMNFLLCILFIVASILPVISGLNTEANISNSYNIRYTGLDESGRFVELGFITDEGVSSKSDETNGPLGEWPDFMPIGFITAPHPDNPGYQTHLYGDWGSIVGEEFIFLQGGMIKLLYHSYHETYMTQRPHEYNVLDNWTLGYDPVTKIKLTPLVKPGGPIPGPAYLHTDTPSYIHHPLTGEHLLYNSVRPGTKDDHPEWVGIPGSEHAIQVATSTTPPAMATPFMQTYENILVAEYWWEQGWNQNGEIKGGLSEPTAVWVPHLGKVRLFYRGLNGAVGNYWTWRISHADSLDGKTDWLKKGTATFDPSVPGNPAYEIWQQTGFRGAWQAHVTGDPKAGGVHMVMIVSNQNYAGGGRISYFWSPDWGDTWIAHPMNPILIPGAHPDGVPAAGFQRTPTLLIDEEYGRYILAYNAGHDINQQWKRRTYLATASRPVVMSNTNVSSGWNFISAPYNFTKYSSELIIKYGDYYYNWPMVTSDVNPTGSPMINPSIFGWNRTLQHYNLAEELDPGFGYWMYSYQPCEILNQYNPNPIDDYITELKTGWNIISIPCSENVNKLDLLVNNANWSDAASSGMVSDFIFGWNSINQYYSFADTIIPGYAYWVYAYQPCILKRNI